MGLFEKDLEKSHVHSLPLAFHDFSGIKPVFFFFFIPDCSFSLFFPIPKCDMRLSDDIILMHVHNTLPELSMTRMIYISMVSQFVLQYN